MKIAISSMVVRSPTQYGGMFAGQNDTVKETHGKMTYDSDVGGVWIENGGLRDLVPVSNIARLSVKETKKSKKADLGDVTAPE